MLSAADLLDAVRGRRLVMELATALASGGDDSVASPLAQALAQAAYRADDARGAGGTLFGWVDGRAATPEELAASMTATPDDVAARLAEVDVPDGLGADLLDVALARTVDSARYWQEPDGTDVVCGHPAVRAALAPLAAAIVAASASHWWSESVSIDQWSVDWEGREPEIAADPSAALAAWRESKLEEVERAARERTDGVNWSGTWWSTPPHDLARSARHLADGTPAAVAFVEDSLGWEQARARRLGFPPGLTVAEIRTPADWAALCRDHPLEVTAEVRHDWERATGRVGRWLMPDWPAVAGVYDAVHLTVAGYLTASGMPVDVGDGFASVVGGWNPDETYWFTDRVRLVDEPSSWRLHDHERWVPAGD